MSLKQLLSYIAELPLNEVVAQYIFACFFVVLCNLFKAFGI